MKFFSDMESSDKTIVSCWVVFVVAALGLMVAVTLFNVHEDSVLLAREQNRSAAIVAMVESGADPIAAKCAIDYGHEPAMCVGYVAGR